MAQQQPAFSSEYKVNRKRGFKPDGDILLAETGQESWDTTPLSKRLRSEDEHCSETNQPVLVASIQELPSEILEQVFSYLSLKQRIQVENVCRRWSFLGREFTWRWPRTLCLEMGRPIVASDAIEAILLRCGKSIKKLHLSKGTSPNEIRSNVLRRVVKTVARFCPNLQHITIFGLRFPNLCFQVLAEGCRKLQSVSLQDSLGFTENALMDFLELCQNLECLDVKGPLKGTCFSMISPKMKVLRLRSMKLRHTGLENIMNRCRFLRELRLPCYNVPPLQVKTLVESYKDTLQVLALEGWTCIDWCSTLELLEHLKALALVNCYPVDDQCIRRLTRECLGLKDLTIYNTRVTDLGLSYLSALPHLTILDISANRWFNGYGVKRVAMEGRLEELHARSTASEESHLIDLGRLCPKLRVVDFSLNKHITNFLVDAFHAAVKSGFLTGPLKLYVGGTSVDERANQCDLINVDFTLQPLCHRVYDSSVCKMPSSITI